MRLARFMDYLTPGTRRSTPTAFPLSSPICGELLATIRTPFERVPALAWKARVQSGDLLSHGPRRQRGARVLPVRGTRQLFDVSHKAWSPPPSHSQLIIRRYHFAYCSIADTSASAVDLTNNQPSFEAESGCVLGRKPVISPVEGRSTLPPMWLMRLCKIIVSRLGAR